MVGGTDYAASQYNRITQAFRQPGSIFKPFVYAAALETAYDVDASSEAEASPAANPHMQSLDDRFITPLTTVMDAPTVFFYGGDIYEPTNYKNDYRGLVTVRTALEHSLNLATIRVAERIGFDHVAALAKRMGLNAKIKGYPSVALGAFEVTPIELAGAYTAFANEGRRMEPHALLRVTSIDGSRTVTLPMPGGATFQDAPAWSNDGTRIAVDRGYSTYNQNMTLAVLPADGTSVGTETAQGLTGCCDTVIEWSPDDKSILVSPEDLSSNFTPQLLWDPATGLTRPAPWAVTADPAWQRIAP